MNPMFFMAKRFIAGESIPEAIQVAKSLYEDGLYVNLNVLGEHVTQKEEARVFLNDYKSLSDQIIESKFPAYISIKLSQLGLDLDPEFCLEQVKEFLRYTEPQSNRPHNLFVRIDMEGSNVTQTILDIFYECRQEFEHVGVVLQAYLHRTEQDMQDVFSKQGTIRLCKGAYKEPAEIALTKSAEVVKRMQALTELALKSGLYHGIASHDNAIIKHVQQFASTHTISSDQFEFQMLYGLRKKMWYQLRDEGYHIRIYIPFGKNWLPYFSRRIRERKENVFFIINNLFR